MRREVLEFPKYSVDDSGVVYDSDDKELPTYIDNGYARVMFRVDGKQFTRKLHRVIAQAFIENIDGKEQIDHINEDKLDNRVENLRWCSHEENCGYYTHGKRNMKPRSIVIDGVVFESVSSASRYIAKLENKNNSSINREMRRFLDGDKKRWKMYKKYIVTKPL